MELKRAFGRRIKTLRELKGFTQAELATRIERSTDAVSMIERGKNWATVETIELLAAALDVQATELLDDLAQVSETAASDPSTMAKHLLKQLRPRDLEVAVAMLRTMVENSPKRRTT